MINLELEHINGKHSDNRLENLTLLCPNCHAQTETYRGKNIKKQNKQVEEKVKEIRFKNNCLICNRNYEVYSCPTLDTYMYSVFFH